MIEALNNEIGYQTEEESFVDDEDSDEEIKVPISERN
jgi:hypothetical protein